MYTYYEINCCTCEWIIQVANLHAKYHIISTSWICSQSRTTVSDYHSAVAVSRTRRAIAAIGQFVIRIMIGVEPYLYFTCINLQPLQFSCSKTANRRSTVEPNLT